MINSKSALKSYLIFFVKNDMFDTSVRHACK
jgi:hypothetical protein